MSIYPLYGGGFGCHLPSAQFFCPRRLMAVKNSNRSSCGMSIRKATRLASLKYLPGLSIVWRKHSNVWNGHWRASGNIIQEMKQMIGMVKYSWNDFVRNWIILHILYSVSLAFHLVKRNIYRVDTEHLQAATAYLLETHRWVKEHVFTFTLKLSFFSVYFHAAYSAFR